MTSKVRRVLPKGDTRSQELMGLNVVERIVCIGMLCGWQTFESVNDDAIDGLILDRRKGRATGTIIHVQVKCGHGYLVKTKSRPRILGINLGEDYIEKHRPRWNILQGPVILIYVDFDSGKAWWTNLKAEESYCPKQNKGLVLIGEKQRFGPHSIGHLRQLRGFVDLDRHLEEIVVDRSDLIVPKFSETLKAAARRYYRGWVLGPASERRSPALGEIKVSRAGWRHLTRRGRGLAKITQSLSLLGVAKRIVLTSNRAYQLRLGTIISTAAATFYLDHISLRCKVIFPHRQQAVVQVILLRKRRIDTKTGNESVEIWFYSVHEPRMGKKYEVVTE